MVHQKFPILAAEGWLEFDRQTTSRGLDRLPRQPLPLTAAHWRLACIRLSRRRRAPPDLQQRRLKDPHPIKRPEETVLPPGHARLQTRPDAGKVAATAGGVAHRPGHILLCPTAATKHRRGAKRRRWSYGVRSPAEPKDWKSSDTHLPAIISRTHLHCCAYPWCRQPFLRQSRRW